MSLFQDGAACLPLPFAIPLVRPVEDGDVQPPPGPAEEEGGRAEGDQEDHAEDQQGERQAHLQGPRQEDALLARTSLRIREFLTSLE